jgi:hypothetical protein
LDLHDCRLGQVCVELVIWDTVRDTSRMLFVAIMTGTQLPAIVSTLEESTDVGNAADLSPQLQKLPSPKDLRIRAKRGRPVSLPA